MAGYGRNFAYGESRYKDQSAGTQLFQAPEPVVVGTLEGRAFFFSHRSRPEHVYDGYGRNFAYGESRYKDVAPSVREYRFTEFMKAGTYQDKWIFGG